MQSFVDYVTHKCGPHWCVAPRLTANMRAKGHETAIHPKPYGRLTEEWERLHYGAPLQSIEGAAPDLFRALKLLVDDPDGLGSRQTASELIQAVEAGAVEHHATRASPAHQEARR